MRDKGSFYRTNEISREPRKHSDWLEFFAEDLAVKEQAAKFQQRTKNASKTAVEVARQRQDTGPSVYEMMSSIISGRKPKYSSVEEAVKDYQERTGLAQFIKQKQAGDLDAVAAQIVQAGDLSNDIGSEISVNPNTGKLWAKDVVNGVEMYIGWDSSYNDYTVYLPQIRIGNPDFMDEEDIDTDAEYRPDQVQRIGTSKENAKKIWGLVKDLAEFGMSPGKIYDYLDKVPYVEEGQMSFDFDEGDVSNADIINFLERLKEKDEEAKTLRPEDLEGKGLADVIELFVGDGGGDDDPNPGGAGPNTVLLEMPELDEAVSEYEEAACGDGEKEPTLASLFESFLGSKKKA